MAVEDALLSLASLAGRTVVAAAATSAWESAKRGFARLLGRGDAARTEVAERRLQQVRDELAGAAASELERVRDRLTVAWQTRLFDLLEDHPETVGELRALVDQVRAQMTEAAVSASAYAVAAGRDVNVSASEGGVAAGTIHGNVVAANPTNPGPANR